MQRLNFEQGQTFVIVTHDAKVGSLCDRVVRMRDGEIVEHGDTYVADIVSDVEERVNVWNSAGARVPQDGHPSTALPLRRFVSEGEKPC
jgi:ABC-type glutathione transport system ATPase component